MDLMKELITVEPVTVTEASSSADTARFEKIWQLIDRDLEHLDTVVHRGNFEELVKRLGGDPAILNEAKEHFHKLHDALMDLHMSVGMANLPAENE